MQLSILVTLLYRGTCPSSNAWLMSLTLCCPLFAQSRLVCSLAFAIWHSEHSQLDLVGAFCEVQTVEDVVQGELSGLLRIRLVKEWSSCLLR
jgi:hypothetical protein